MQTLRLTADPAELEATVAELSELLEAAVDLPDGVRESLDALLEGSVEVFRLEGDPLAAVGAGQIDVAIHPSAALLDLLAAVRTRNRQIAAEGSRHYRAS